MHSHAHVCAPHFQWTSSSLRESTAALTKWMPHWKCCVTFVSQMCLECSFVFNRCYIPWSHNVPVCFTCNNETKQIYDEMQHSNRIWHSAIQYDRSKYKCNAVNCGTQHNKIWLLVYRIHKQNQQSNFFWLTVSLPQWKKKDFAIVLLLYLCVCVCICICVCLCVWVCVWVG